MSTVQNRSFVVIPTIGKFIIHITKNDNSYNEKLGYYMVMVGIDPRNACVNIRVPYDSDKPLILAYITSEVACTLDNITPIKGLATVQMIQLGITIARELSPNATKLDLDDFSHFNCSSADSITRKMALPSFYIAFHGKTWYEDKFGAIIKDDSTRLKYEKGITNLNNPAAKPKTFEFLNQDISEILNDLYNSSTTWNEFFQKIEKKYKNKKCWVIQPWIEEAMKHVFGRLIYERETWTINLNNVPTLSYYQLNETVPMLGGGWKDPFLERVIHRTSFYTALCLMPYKDALRSTRIRRRSKSSSSTKKRAKY